MTTSYLNEIIDSIRSLLDERPTSMASEVVALEYSRLCREVNERLGRIAPMLDGGGEIQALQLAEQQPRVLDLAVALSFGREGEWQEYCLRHGHEVATLIDARIFEQLLAIQEKGVSPNHPLYKDYRAAVSSRNDAKAFELIRIITRLNPGDENAAREITRLERKAVQVAIADLRKALSEKNEADVMATVARLEESSEPENYQNLPEWQEARLVRERYRREDARQRMPQLLVNAEEELKAGNWRVAAVWHGEFVQLLDTYGLDQDAASMASRSQALDNQLIKLRSDADRAGRVNQLTAEMCQIADEVEIRAVTPYGLTPDFCGPLLDKISRKWRQVEELRGEVPLGSSARIDATRARLTQSIERSRSARKMKAVTITSVIALVLLAAIGWGLLALRASGHAKMLGELQAKESTNAVRDLLERVNGKESLLLKFSSLSAAVAESQRWLDTATQNADLTEKEMQRLETAREEEFEQLPSLELCERLDEMDKLIAKLPTDLKSAPETRLAVVRNEAERVMQKRQESADKDALQIIAQWTNILHSVDYKESSTLADEASKGAGAAFAPFLDLANNTNPFLRLPASTETSLQDLERGFTKVREQVDADQNALAALKSAQAPDAYREAIESLSKGSFKEAQVAQKTLDGWPDEDRMKAFLLFKNDLIALKSAEDDLSSDLPMPEAATKLDRDIISELMASESLNHLWEVELKTINGQQKYLAQKKPDASSPTKYCVYPEHFATSLEFKELPNASVISERILPTSELMARLQLEKLLDDTGTEYRNSILPLIDRVMNASTVTPLARAHVLEKLFKLIRGRERAWGAQFCPDLLDDIEEFNELSVKSSILENSWLLEKKPDYAKPWEDYFATRTNRSFTTNVKNMKSAVRYSIRNPIALVGRVDSNGEITLDKQDKTRLLLGISELQPGVTSPCVLGIAIKDAPFTPSIKPIPLSPILTIEMPEADQLFLQKMHMPDASTTPNTSNP